MELKYKVWDKEQKKFLRIDDEDEGCAKPNYYQHLHFTLNGKADEDGYPYQIDADILPSTGVKDINKKESYSGDVLKKPVSRWFSEERKEKDRKKKYFYIIKKELNNNNMYLEYNFNIRGYWETNNLSLCRIEELEIVGNIFQNQDMIKKEG